jgi:hypothetical protein
LVAIVITGLMPNALLSGAGARAGSAWSTPGAPAADFFTPETVVLPFLPSACLDASCSKGAPAPATPTLTIVAAAALAGVLYLAATSRLTRRLRSAVADLPRGNFIGLFRPPQFS